MGALLRNQGPRVKGGTEIAGDEEVLWVAWWLLWMDAWHGWRSVAGGTEIPVEEHVAWRSREWSSIVGGTVVGRDEVHGDGYGGSVAGGTEIAMSDLATGGYHRQWHGFSIGSNTCGNITSCYSISLPSWPSATSVLESEGVSTARVRVGQSISLLCLPI